MFAFERLNLTVAYGIRYGFQAVCLYYYWWPFEPYEVVAKFASLEPESAFRRSIGSKFRFENTQSKQI